PLEIDEDLAEVALCIGPRPRPVDVPPRQEDRLAQPIQQAGLLAAEPANPVTGQAQPAHHVVNELGRDPSAIEPMFLPDIETVLERNESLFKQPDIEIDIPFYRPESMIAHEQERRIGGQQRMDGTHTPIERLPELDQLGTQGRELCLPALGRPVGQVPDVPQLMAQAI